MHLTGRHAHLRVIGYHVLLKLTIWMKEQVKNTGRSINLLIFNSNHSSIEYTQVFLQKSTNDGWVMKVGKPCTAVEQTLKSAIVLSTWAASKRDVAVMGIHSKEILPVKHLPVSLRQRGVGGP